MVKVSDWRQSETAFFPSVSDHVPAVTTAQMALVDQLAVRQYGIDLLQMMENAGGALARVVRTLWPDSGTVTVLAGGGGNGGGALAAGRRLHGFGMEVSVVLDRPVADLTGAAAHQAATLRAMEIELRPEPDTATGTVVVDGLIGYGLDRAPDGRAAELIEWCRGAESVVSLDVPSGVDATTGHKHTPHVAPQVTVTLALPKTGLTAETAGMLLLADIGIPSVLYTRHLDISGTSSIFSRGDIVRLSEESIKHPS